MKRSKTTLIATILVATILSACGGSEDGETVRNGPQVVHPSPSALAASGLSF